MIIMRKYQTTIDILKVPIYQVTYVVPIGLVHELYILIPEQNRGSNFEKTSQRELFPLEYNPRNRAGML